MPLSLVLVPYDKLLFFLIDVPSMIFLQAKMYFNQFIMRTSRVNRQWTLSLPLKFIHIDYWQFLSSSSSQIDRVLLHSETRGSNSRLLSQYNLIETLTMIPLILYWIRPWMTLASLLSLKTLLFNNIQASILLKLVLLIFLLTYFSSFGCHDNVLQVLPLFFFISLLAGFSYI